MGKSKNKITNWPDYNCALTQRGSITFWVYESAIEAWTCTKHHGKRGRGFKFSDVAIETAYFRYHYVRYKVLLIPFFSDECTAA